MKRAKRGNLSGRENIADERKGLGTPATRAGIIEKLVKTGFVERKKKLLIPTNKGTNLIAVLPEEVKSPLLTAEWEQKLKLIERGELAEAVFMEGVAALIQGIVTAHTAPLSQYASLFASERTDTISISMFVKCKLKCHYDSFIIRIERT